MVMYRFEKENYSKRNLAETLELKKMDTATFFSKSISNPPRDLGSFRTEKLRHVKASFPSRWPSK